MTIPTSSGGFVKVFDVLDSGFTTFSILVIWLCGIGLIILFLFMGERQQEKAPQPRSWIQLIKKRRSFAQWWGYAALVFMVIGAASTFPTHIREHMRHVALLQNSACSVVEGPVERFVPLIPRPHSCPFESFDVQGVRFRYSDYWATDSFKASSYYGGPVNKDSYVRICYDPEKNAILRLEIRQ
jgi:hypothetical protein